MNALDLAKRIARSLDAEHIDYARIATRFNDAINARDIDALTALMTDDHRFIDTEGNTFDGKARAREIWTQFFATFPDYQNHFATLIDQDGRAVIAGHSTCAHASLAGPALWVANVRDGLVWQWQVYVDTPENRARLGLA